MFAIGQMHRSGARKWSGLAVLSSQRKECDQVGQWSPRQTSSRRLDSMNPYLAAQSAPAPVDRAMHASYAHILWTTSWNTCDSISQAASLSQRIALHCPVRPRTHSATSTRESRVSSSADSKASRPSSMSSSVAESMVGNPPPSTNSATLPSPVSIRFTLVMEALALRTDSSVLLRTTPAVVRFAAEADLPKAELHAGGRRCFEGNLVAM